MDRCIRPFSYLALLAVMGVEVWLFFFAPDTAQQRYLTPATILFSALAAICGWMWSGQFNRRLARRTQAVNLLLALRGEQVNDWKEKVYAYIDSGGTGQQPTKEFQELLGFYEFISICVMNGSADEAMIEQSQRLVFYRLYHWLKPYIESVLTKHSDLYCHFIHYTKQWNPDKFPGMTTRPTFIDRDTEF